MMICYIVSILLLCIGNYLRTLRWEQIISVYEEPDRKSMLLSLSVSQIINLFLPFRMGDCVRAFLASKKMKNGFSFSLATVVVERCLDIIVVGAIFGVFYHIGLDNGKSTFIYYIILAVVLLAFFLCTFLSKKYIKKFILRIAGIFNNRIEESILKFIWGMVWSFKAVIKILPRIIFVLMTIAMWSAYMFSYYLFALYMSSVTNNTISLSSVFFDLFAKESLVRGGYGMLNQYSLSMLYLLSGPLLCILATIFLKGNRRTDTRKCLNLFLFSDKQEGLEFLREYFWSEKRDYIDNYLTINRDILILKNLSAGSNASTLLCTDGKTMFYRKYAFGNDATKLWEQVCWIREHEEDIPLTRILRFERKQNYCFYDMSYDSKMIGLFEYLHSHPKTDGWLRVKNVLEMLKENLFLESSMEQASKKKIDEYIESKVNDNLKIIMGCKQFKKILSYDEIWINGLLYHNLPYYLRYLSKDYLEGVFKGDKYTTIHGDLTIENIIVNRDETGGGYLIDPNTNNIHNAYALDYAKLLQSLHGNYELLMAVQDVEVHNNNINYLFVQSDTYSFIYEQYDKYLKENFTLEEVKSIYWHEVIHWLRLLPYKIKKNPQKAVVFYAGLIKVLDDIEKKFEK